MQQTMSLEKLVRREEQRQKNEPNEKLPENMRKAIDTAQGRIKDAFAGQHTVHASLRR